MTEDCPKRRKLDESAANHDVKGSDKNFAIYILPNKVQKKRHDLLKWNSERNQFPVVDKFSCCVSHVVSDCDTADQVCRALQITRELQLHIVSTRWLSECLANGRIVEVKSHHLLKDAKKVEPSKESSERLTILPQYACQMPTKLHHPNIHFTKALEILERDAEFHEVSSGNVNSRVLAFHRGACALASLPGKVTSMRQLIGLKHIGAHCKNVIEEILTYGKCEEVERILKDDWSEKMKLFTGVHGVGIATAAKWIRMGFSSIQDVIDSSNLNLDQRITHGLQFYDDLRQPVSKDEAIQLTKLITHETERLLPGATVELIGGFRRGKSHGHDVDLLLSHPDEGREIGLLQRLLDRLTHMNLIVFGTSQRNTFSKSTSQEHSNNTMDHYEKWLGALKLHESNGRACRVDLVIAPARQYYYALIGWTGSRHFNRSLRLYAQRELNMRLNSHELYDLTSHRNLPANSEREVFENVKLSYLDPSDRNC